MKRGRGWEEDGEEREEKKGTRMERTRGAARGE